MFVQQPIVIMVGWTTCSFILLLFPFLGLAQDFPVRNYSARDGLVRNAVRAIYQDRGGWLWLATSDGVDRYDGATFTHFTTKNGLAHDFVNDVVEDSAGTVWFATNFAGLSGFCGGRFRNILVAPDAPASFANRVNSLFVEDAHALWLATDRGVFRLSNNRVSTIVPDVTGTSFARDSSGTLWLGTTNGLLNAADSSGSRVLTPVGDSHLEITSLACTPDGILWIGTTRGLFFRLPGRDHRGRWQGERLVRLLRGEWIRCLMAESDNTLWIGTANRGALKALPNGSIVTLNEMNGLCGNTISDIMRDREGTIWIATTTGLSKLVSEQMVNYNRAHGLADHGVSAITRDAFGGMWFGTRQGVTRMIDGRLSTYKRANGLSDDYVLTLYTSDDGTLWCGTEAGPVRVQFRGSRPTFVAYGANSGWKREVGMINRVRAIYRDEDGNLWFGSDQGVSLLRGGTFITHEVETFGERLVSGIVRDVSGDLWVGLHNGGIVRYAVDALGALGFSMRLKERLGAEEGLKDGNIRCAMRARNGDLWFGTRFGGAVRIALSAGRIESIHHYTIAEEIASNWVNGIIEDRRGTFWLATARGMSQLRFPNNEREVLSVRSLTVEDGLAGDGVNTVYEDINGFLWFGTYNGVTRFDPSEQMPDSVKPPIYLTNVIVSGESDSAALSAGGVNLGYDHHSIGFEFIGISFRGEGKMRYEYMLDGFDTTWSAPTDHRYAAYTHLPAGWYVFKVRAINGDGVRSAMVASFPFTVAPPFWATWWFVLFALAAVTTLALVVHRARLQQAVALERLRLRIAADLHDDVGSTLSSIAISSELARKELANSPSIADVLRHINANARSVMELIDDAVWAINPGNDSLDDILLRMRSFAAEVLEARGIRCIAEFPKARLNVRIPMEKRRHLYLAFKEAMNNVAQHSGCSNVCIVVEVAPRMLSLSIEDDGRGFAADAISSGNGLRNMKRRAGELGGVLEINSAQGRGTAVRLTLPLT